LIEQKDIINILKTGKLVVVDEAYAEFSNVTVIPLLKKYDNLIVVRTFSKWAGLAGLRIGYAITSPTFVDQLLKIKPPFNINNAAEAAAIATLQDLSYTTKTIKKIITDRERLYKILQTFSFIKVYPGFGNFLFLQTDKENFVSLKKLFEKNKIALRYYSALNGIRITIGKPLQNNKIIIVIRSFTFQQKYAFLDRDGTLIFEPQDTYQIDSIKKFKILDGVIQGLTLLKNQGYKLVMVTNQDGLGTDSFPKVAFQLAQNTLLGILKKEGIIFSDIFICPHFSSDQCRCRKPKTGLVTSLLNNIDKKNSLVCGDRNTDKEFAKNLGINFVPMKTNGNFYEALIKKELIK
ncbi:MAG TPA: histidinol-phosphatase, partial [Methylomirabilota bacterium]|nr:histidinol-phosphatase [Methylomirabilota bacterium]